MKNLRLLSWLSRKKLTDEQVANIFVNTSFDTVEQGWPQVAAFLNAAPEFSTSPELDSEDYGKFLMIVVSANLVSFPSTLTQVSTGPSSNDAAPSLGSRWAFRLTHSPERSKTSGRS